MPAAALDQYDAVIIGGGPGGSTVGTFIKKYEPSLRVVILEREKFPREHIGESQLPACGAILNEMGVWDKVEAANFPIKVGVTYRWGNSDRLWDFELLQAEAFRDEPRPARFEGQRRITAFQVDRARYDKILLDHAREMGCEVLEETRAASFGIDGDRVLSVTTDTGRTFTGRHFIDASGHAGILRRALGVKVDIPTKLMNIAIWDYWDNAEWAVKIGVGGTRVQIMSMKNGWIWFIPLGPTRTSIGFVCLAEYYRRSGKKPEELYLEAVRTEPRIAELIRNATPEGVIRTTKDWSFLSDRLVGENWFLVGEAGGFADPILSGGMTLTHASARDAAYVICEMHRGNHDVGWMKKNYESQNRARIAQYIRFADFWYSANGQFTDLQDLTAQIAKDAGLKLTPQDAFRWLSFGGFTSEDWLSPGLGALDLVGVKEVAKMFSGAQKAIWDINKYNVFRLNLLGATKEKVSICHQGRIVPVDSYRRADRVLPGAGLFAVMIDILRQPMDAAQLGAAIRFRAASRPKTRAMLSNEFFFQQCMATLETMLAEGWVRGMLDKTKPMLNYDPLAGGGEFNIHDNWDDQIEDRRRRSGAAKSPPRNPP